MPIFRMYVVGMLVHGAHAASLAVVDVSITSLLTVGATNEALASSSAAFPTFTDTTGEVEGSSEMGDAVGRGEGSEEEGTSAIGEEDGPSVGDVLIG